MRIYIWGQEIDNLLAFTDHTTSNTYYAIKDHQNTILALVNTSGAVVESYEYSAYGETRVFSRAGTELAASALGNRYTFQGREIDWTTGLMSFRARWYHAETGRWLSKDPIGISGGLNLYAFCGNNPVNFVDPMGLFRFGDRPLAGYPDWSANLGTQLPTQRAAHEHGFFEDGSGENIGFMGPSDNSPGGVQIAHNSQAENPSGYTLSSWRYDDDDLMREAIGNVNATMKFTVERYNLLWDNCRDYALALKREYVRLGGVMTYAKDGLRGCSE